VLQGFGHFQVLTAEEFNTRFAHKLYDGTLLNPSNANVLEQGEWLTPTAADGSKYERAAAGGNGPNVALPIAESKAQPTHRVEARSRLTTFGNRP